MKHIALIIAWTLLGSAILLPQHSTHASYTDEGIAFYAYPDHTVGTQYQAEGVAFYAFAAQADGTVPVHRFVNTTNGDHFYTADENEKNTLIAQHADIYTYEGIAFYSYISDLHDAQPIYRFVNHTNGDHFYTISQEEKDYITQHLSTIYASEGIAFYAYPHKAAGTTTVYRFINHANGDHFYTANDGEAATLDNATKMANHTIYRFINTTTGNHFYTADENEKRTLLQNRTPYRYEGAAFYAFRDPKNNAQPVYRFNHTITGNHFYTISTHEKDQLSSTASGYIYEGVAFYAYPTPTVGTLPVHRLYNTRDHFYTINDIEKHYALIGNTGPLISVGLWHYDRSAMQQNPFEINANKPYNIRDKSGAIIAQIGGSTRTKVTYDGGGSLKVYSSISDRIIDEKVTFDAADGDNATMIFDVHRPQSSYDHYRGSITVRYYSGRDIIGGTTNSVKQIWVINTLPMEHYVWGMGEMTGTGPFEHSKVMTTMFRTYGKWYVDYATKYAPLGFKIRSDSGSQIYRGYDWEQKYSTIRKAAEATRGVIMTSRGETALTPYSSWSDGRTRSFEERWGSRLYPWCQSVKDPYGKHATKSTSTLETEGNHMVGLIAHGSLALARDHGWSYARIMRYYYKDIALDAAY